MTKKTIRDIDVKDQKVLVRVPFNVPIKDGQVTDDFRIKAELPTLRYLLNHGASLILLSHHSKEGTSLAPVAPVLQKLLDRPVKFVADVLSDEAKSAAEALQPGDVLLMENLRFHPEEEANDAGFAKAIAALGDLFVEDDFTTLHREHASIVGIPKHLPAVSGLQVEQEVEYIQGKLEHPNRPLVAIISGAKVSTKVPVLENLIPKVDALFLGGAMANTFFLAQGHAIGQSLAEPDLVEECNRLLKLAAKEDCQLFLPDTVVVSKSLDEAKDVRTVKLAAVKDDDYIADVAPAFAATLGPAVYAFLDFDNKCTVIWNGPLGKFEVPEFAAGTEAMAEAIIKLPGAISIIGGGDTAGFVDGAGLHDKFTWVSTGGGASLELMSGNKLPGLEALLDK